MHRQYRQHRTRGGEALRWRIGLGLAVVGLGVLLLIGRGAGAAGGQSPLLLIAAMDDLAAGEGDLTKRVGLNSKDEIGDMAGGGQSVCRQVAAHRA
jgi:methyl-accepting chemotaxis protein